MAAHLDLEEQEQLAEIKHFWAKHGNWITWLLIVVLSAYAGWNGWQYWQRKSALEAAVLYDELERAAQAKDVDKVKRVWADMQSGVSRTTQAHHGGLLAAKVLYEAGQAPESKAALQFVVDKAGDAGVVAAARLRLAGVELDAQAYDAALKVLGGTWPNDFEGLAADRRGDVLLAQGKADEAREAYRKAYAALPASQDYRRVVEVKLNALGVDPTRTDKPE